ncbi:hypothetical protein [Parashewanella tropica]|uniref:hypothetical protein n=1 Tax=Parashewanella tropica TaxID=2547970 RepID=UPI0010596E1D|nr:hypothetical protein [Parashewanella tropica]
MRLFQLIIKSLNTFVLFSIVISPMSLADRLSNTSLPISVHTLQVDLSADPKPVPLGFIYTSTNDPKGNTVLQVTRYSNGQVGNEISYPTRGAGAADPNRNGLSKGNFDSSGAMQIVDHYLFTVNAGDNSFTVFNINKTNGNLTFLYKVSSGGTRPVSLLAVAQTKFPKKDPKVPLPTGIYRIFVANQQSNPSVQGDGKQVKRYPNEAYFNQDLTVLDKSDSQRNVSEYTFDSHTGKLTLFKAPLFTFNRDSGGPISLGEADSGRGRYLLVSTAGIPHLFTEQPETGQFFMHPSLIRAYYFDQDTGSVFYCCKWQPKSFAGVSGFLNDYFGVNLNFVLSMNHNDDQPDFTGLLNIDSKLVSSTKNQLPLIDGNTHLTHNGWMAMTSIQSAFPYRYYVSSFDNNAVMTLQYQPFGSPSVTIKQFTYRKDYAPKGDSKDLYVTPDGKYVYNLGAFRSYSLSGFAADDSGLTYQGQYTFKATQAAAGQAGRYNFMGLVGFDLNKK